MSTDYGPDDPDQGDQIEKLDETFSIISKKEKKLREALVKTEQDYISTEINLGVCGSLIEFYKAEIKKEQEKNK